MVKSISLTLAALLLSICLFVFTERYLDDRFGKFYDAVDTLYEKTEQGKANAEDAEAVRTLWATERSRLHVFIPHNDITYVDHRLNTALSYIYTENYSDALANLEVVLQMAKTLPGNYKMSIENIF